MSDIQEPQASFERLERRSSLALRGLMISGLVLFALVAVITIYVDLRVFNQLGVDHASNVARQVSTTNDIKQALMGVQALFKKEFSQITCVLPNKRVPSFSCHSAG
jgi:hypothetical protein